MSIQTSCSTTGRTARWKHQIGRSQCFVIACESCQRREMLFLVDRRKQRASFWSHSLDDALILGDRESAENRIASLQFNSPRVISLSEATEYLNKKFLASRR